MWRKVPSGFLLATVLTLSGCATTGRNTQTEIDALNGYVVRRGAELGIPTPVNQALHALVKVLEEGGNRAS